MRVVTQAELLGHASERFRRRVGDMSEAAGNGQLDLAVLVRQELQRLNVSVALEDRAWTEFGDWDRVGCDAVNEGNRTIVSARPWLPAWSDNVQPDVMSAREARVRQNRECDADAFYRVWGDNSYLSPGQRDAVRVVASAPGGETNLVILPTGSGKTSVFVVPAAMAKPRVTVVIVPTVSLALDLERRIAEQFGVADHIAYHGGLDAAAKRELRQRLEGGSQWIVVTSPEAACASLSRTIVRLSENGNLAYVAVDEAHMVLSWGGAFRPAFRGLSALLRRCRQVAPDMEHTFVTVLSTATIDSAGLVQLRDLFAVEDRFNAVVDQRTRPEPGYWQMRCVDAQDKRKRLVDALLHLPRPLILYASLVESDAAVNVRELGRWVEDAGFERVRTVTGASSFGDRETAARSLACRGRASDDCDIVIASAAFGLGVDIGGVRSVVHACVPESIHRFYQEVGRGGRDGNACVSLVLHTQDDRDVARNLGADGGIGPDLAWARWNAMRTQGEHAGQQIRVSLWAFHPGVQHPHSEANIRWNLHTLMQMEQAGFIRIERSDDRAVPDDLTEEQVAEFYEAHSEEYLVTVLDGSHGVEDEFKRRISLVKLRDGDGGDAALAPLLALLDSDDRCVNEYFADAYRLHFSNGDRTSVGVQCNGCPHCRRVGMTHSGTPSSPYLRVAKRPFRSSSLFPAISKPPGVVHYRDRLTDSQAQRLFRALLRKGIREFIVDPLLLAVAFKNSTLGSDWSIVSSIETIQRRPHYLPACLVLSSGVSVESLREALDAARSGVVEVVVTPSALHCGDEPTLVRELWNPSMSIETFFERVSA